MGRQIALYFAWDRCAEAGAPLGVLDNRFPALFEVRRLLWPRFEKLADGARFDQGIAGFIEHIFLENFRGFAEQAQSASGHPVRIAHRRVQSNYVAIDHSLLTGVDTLIIISFDSLGTRQSADPGEIGALREFLRNPDHTLFVCPHHDIGAAEDVPAEELLARQIAEFRHHADAAIPGQQRFGGYALSVLSGLGLPIRNRFGLRPARNSDGSPAPFKLVARDRSGLFLGLKSLNLHPHLPHFEPHEAGASKLEVLIRQPIDSTASEHPFAASGRTDFDAVLQSRADVFAGHLLVTDATVWASVFGGLVDLSRFWWNVALQPTASAGT